ncbi:MAG: transposase [Planctomycetota bacterium]
MCSRLACYANRVVIANDRVIKIDGDEVFFWYKG